MTETFFYRFSSKLECMEEIGVYFQDGEWYSPDFAIDAFGLIYKPSGEFIGEGDDRYEVHTVVDGWHVNTTSRIPDKEAFEVFPVTPYRVFA